MLTPAVQWFISTRPDAGAGGCFPSLTQLVGLFSMPTIVVEGPFQVRILNPPREHAPAHVHVVRSGGSDGEVLINLGQPDRRDDPWGPVSLREVHGMSQKDVVQAVRVVEAHLEHLRREWRRIHG